MKRLTYAKLVAMQEALSHLYAGEWDEDSRASVGDYEGAAEWIAEQLAKRYPDRTGWGQ